jgi:hypothetical protein
MVSALVIGRHVDLRPADRSHDRLVADIVLRDGRIVGAVLVGEGAAWVDPQPCSARPPSGRPAGTAAALARRLSCAALGVAPTARTGTRAQALEVVAGVVLAMSSGQGREIAILSSPRAGVEQGR